MINKHEVLRAYISGFLTNNHLYFENIKMYPNMMAIVPSYGDYTIKTDITGAKYKEYTFAFVGVRTYDKDGISNINTDNMNLFDSFIEWIETKEKNKQYPNFGTNTSGYKIEPLQNMANMSMVDESTSTAKYMLACKVSYMEREQTTQSV